MIKFQIVKSKFKINKKGRITKRISYTIQNLDNGKIYKIKVNTVSDLEKLIINRIQNSYLECGDCFNLN
jgi:predicted nuclease of restriction endonuclease-like (RecB) superfamily